MISSTYRVTFLVSAVMAFSAGDAQDADQVAVYEALFAQVESLGFDKTYFVREREARPPMSLGQAPFRFSNQPAIHDLEDFGRIRVSLVDESFIAGLWDSGCQQGWDSFHRRYPEASDLTQISEVLFNDRIDEAAVYLEQGRGCRSSCGLTYRLEKRAGVWALSGRAGGWCS